MRRGLILFLFLATSSSFAVSGGPDGYGYTFKDQAEVDGPVYQWIDITNSGAVVVSDGVNTASTAPGPVGIGGPVTLGRPFTIYGVEYNKLVPAVNGYISGDPMATGADNSPDCPFPSVPGSDPSGLRLNPFHANLNLTNVASQVLYEYFDVSPHPHSCLGVSVFSWVQAYEAQQSSFYDFQVLIFDNGDVLFQYQTECFTKFATVGIQDDTVLPLKGLNYSCNTTPGITIAANTVVLFEPPIIEVTTEVDQLDVPAGAEVSLLEAVRDVPVGGKIHLMTGDEEITFSEAFGSSVSIEITNSVSIDGQFNPGG